MSLKDGKAVSAPDPRERYWITYTVGASTITDTLNTAYSSNVTTTGVVYKVPPSIRNQYPLTTVAGYKSICGNVYLKTKVLQQPNLKIRLYTSSALNCAVTTYTFQAYDSLLQGEMHNNYFSNYRGATWEYSAFQYSQDTLLNSAQQTVFDNTSFCTSGCTQ